MSLHIVNKINKQKIKIMKATVVLFFSLIVSLSVAGQLNSFDFGDKTPKEIKADLKVINSEISTYEKEISFLQFDSKRNPNTLNDSLISAYRAEIYALRMLKKEILIVTASNSRTQRVSSRTNSPSRLAAAANAYAVMTYADAYVQNKQSGGSSDLKALVVNYWYQDVSVTVRGLAGWERQFFLSGNGGRASFQIPTPGNYTFIFSNGRTTKAVVKRCQPGLSESYENGEKYDVMAILPKSH